MPASSESSRSVLTPTEVAKVLRISRTLVYRLIQTGEIPSFRVGRSIRVLEGDLYAGRGVTS